MAGAQSTTGPLENIFKGASNGKRRKVLFVLHKACHRLELSAYSQPLNKIKPLPFPSAQAQAFGFKFLYPMMARGISCTRQVQYFIPIMNTTG